MLSTSRRSRASGRWSGVSAVAALSLALVLGAGGSGPAAGASPDRPPAATAGPGSVAGDCSGAVTPTGTRVAAGARPVVGRVLVLHVPGRLLRAGTHRHPRHVVVRWALLHRPLGSHARLRQLGRWGAHGRALLRPDLPGHYVVEVTARRGSTVHRRVRTVSATDPDLLVPLDTIAHTGTPSVTGVQAGAMFCPVPGGQPLQVVVLRRDTLELLSNTGYGASAGDYTTLGTDLKALTKDDLVIVTHPGGQPPLPSDSLATLDTSLREIGGTVPAQWVFGDAGCSSIATNQCQMTSATWQRSTLSGGSFSVIGIPGLAAGQAWRETAAQTHDTDGRISGYLTLGTLTTGGTGDYTVVNGPDPYAPVTTCDTSACSVTVGGQTFPATAGVDGFHVVVLDRTTLAPLVNRTVTTTAQLDSAITTSASPAVAHIVVPPPVPVYDQQLVVIQSVGTGQLTGAPSLSLFQHLDQLGGTPEYLDASLDGTHRYALVGAATDLPWRSSSPMESSTAMSDRSAGTTGQPTGQLSGVVQRDRDGLYSPSAGDAVGPTNVDLYRILFQASTPWPYADDTGGLRYVADSLGLCRSSDDGCPYADVRSAYTNTAEDFGSLIPALKALQCTQGPDVCTDFPGLQAQLENEFHWLGNVTKLHDDLLAPYGDDASKYFNVQAVTEQVMKSVPLPPTQITTMSWLKIFSALMTIAQNIAKPLPAAASVFGIAGAGATAATYLMQQPTGAPASTVTAQAQQLSADLANQQEAYAQWVNQTRQSLVSDAGRLTSVGSSIDTDPSWKWTDATTDALITALDGSTRAAAYSALIPAAWGGYDLKPGPNQPHADDVTHYHCAQVVSGVGGDHVVDPTPFAGALPANQFNSLYAITTSGTEDREVWTFAKVSGFEDGDTPSATVPTTDLTDDIYGEDSTDGGVGAYQYEAAWWRSTFDPPSHTTCTATPIPAGLTRPYSTAWAPPDIAPPLP